MGLQSVEDLIEALRSYLPGLDRKRVGVWFARNFHGTSSAFFLDRYRGPFAVAKFAARPSAEEVVNNEYAVLTELRQVGPRLARSTPTPIGAADLSLGRVAYYSYCPGEHVLPQDARNDALLNRRVVNWVLALHKRTRRDVVFDRELFVHRLAGPSETTMEMYGLSETTRLALNRGLSLAEKIVGETVPVVTEHGDLSARNVLRNSDSPPVYLLDWEFSRRRGLPLFDLLNWFFNNARGQDGVSNCVAAAEMCASPQGEYGRRFRSALAHYCGELGWRPKDMGAWLTAYFIRGCAELNCRPTPRLASTPSLNWVPALPRIWEIGQEMGASLGWSSGKT